MTLLYTFPKTAQSVELIRVAFLAIRKNLTGAEQQYEDLRPLVDDEEADSLWEAVQWLEGLETLLVTLPDCCMIETKFNELQKRYAGYDKTVDAVFKAFETTENLVIPMRPPSPEKSLKQNYQFRSTEYNNELLKLAIDATDVLFKSKLIDEKTKGALDNMLEVFKTRKVFSQRDRDNFLKFETIDSTLRDLLLQTLLPVSVALDFKKQVIAHAYAIHQQQSSLLFGEQQDQNVPGTSISTPQKTAACKS